MPKIGSASDVNPYMGLMTQGSEVMELKDESRAGDTFSSSFMK